MFLHVVATFSFVSLVLNITSSERSSLMNPFQAGLPLPPYSWIRTGPVNHCTCPCYIICPPVWISLSDTRVCASRGSRALAHPWFPGGDVYSLSVWHAASFMNMFVNKGMLPILALASKSRQALWFPHRQKQISLHFHFIEDRDCGGRGWVCIPCGWDLWNREKVGHFQSRQGLNWGMRRGTSRESVALGRDCRQGDDWAGSAGSGLFSSTGATAFQVSRGQVARSLGGDEVRLDETRVRDSCQKQREWGVCLLWPWNPGAPSPLSSPTPKCCLFCFNQSLSVPPHCGHLTNVSHSHHFLAKPRQGHPVHLLQCLLPRNKLVKGKSDLD